MFPDVAAGVFLILLEWLSCLGMVRWLLGLVDTGVDV